MPDIVPLPPDYADWLAELKSRIHAAQQRASLSVNRELVLLYWHIGREILQRQSRDGWGSKVIDRLSQDLRNAFPDMKGFSPRNLKYMRAFANAWPDAAIVQEVLAQLPWYHQIALLDKLRTADQRHWYASKAIEHHWSRNVLVMQIETCLLERSGQAVTNFPVTLPKPQSDLAHESIKDPFSPPNCKPACPASRASNRHWQMKRGEMKHEPARLHDSLTSEQRKKLSSMHSEKLAIKVANIDVSKGPESSLTVSTPSDDETKKPKESPGLVSICRLLANAGFTLTMGEEGLEPPTSTL